MWPFGFPELTPRERMDFFEAVGFAEDEIPQDDALRKQLSRWRFREVWADLSTELQLAVGLIAGHKALEGKKLGGPFLGV